MRKRHAGIGTHRAGSAGHGDPVDAVGCTLPSNGGESGEVFMKRVLAASMMIAAFAACSSSNTGALTDPSSTPSSPAAGVGTTVQTGYCGVSADLEARSNAFSSSSFDPTNKSSIRDLFTSIRDTANRAVGLAPSEIKADVQVLADGFSVFVDALAKANYDFTNPDAQAAAKALDDAKFKAASARITAYGKTNCK